MPSSKSNPGAWLDRVVNAGLWVAVGLLVVLGVIWLVSTNSAPSPGPPRTSTGESTVEKAETQEPQKAPADGDAKGASWISFERILLLAVVVANYLLLAAVAWSYWRGRQLNGGDLSQRLQAIGAQLEAIDRTLRTGPPKPTTPPSPAAPDSAPRAKGYEPPREPSSRLASQPAAEPVRQAPVSQESPSPPARTGSVDESRRSPKSAAWDLVHQYCLIRGSSIVDLGQRAKAQGLQIGSPSSTRGQRHILDSPDQDPRLLAIKDGREERLFVVVGPDANVAESEWLDLFEMRGFIGYCAVRSKRPAIVNSASGEVEEKGELEVLGPT